MYLLFIFFFFKFFMKQHVGLSTVPVITNRVVREHISRDVGKNMSSHYLLYC